jgi:hypothetical protein
MEQHPHDPSLDDFSKKESAIVRQCDSKCSLQIYTLYHRTKEIEDRRRAEHTARPLSSSLRGTQDNVSAERHEPMPVHRGAGTSNGLIRGPNGTPLQVKSPLTGFMARQSPMNQSGTHSPDDDQPQQLYVRHVYCDDNISDEQARPLADVEHFVWSAIVIARSVSSGLLPGECVCLRTRVHGARRCLG